MTNQKTKLKFGSRRTSRQWGTTTKDCTVKDKIYKIMHTLKFSREVGFIRDLIQHVKLTTQFFILSLGLQPLASYITHQAIQAA
jgi:hypothetical protein